MVLRISIPPTACKWQSWMSLSGQGYASVMSPFWEHWPGSVHSFPHTHGGPGHLHNTRHLRGSWFWQNSLSKTRNPSTELFEWIKSKEPPFKQQQKTPKNQTQLSKILFLSQASTFLDIHVTKFRLLWLNFDLVHPFRDEYSSKALSFFTPYFSWNPPNTLG